MKIRFSGNTYIGSASVSLAVLCVLSLLVVSPTAHAQTAVRNVVSPAGETSSGSRASLSWTLGDLSAGNYLTPTLQYREGFLSTPLRVTAIEPLPSAWKVEVYPNPAHTRLSVALGAEHPALTLQLHDLSGRVLQSNVIEANAQMSQLQLDRLPSGSYLLRVVDIDGRSAGSYQIRKIK